MPRSKPRKRIEIRQVVIAAAEQIVQRRGIVAATIDEIASSSGISVGSIYAAFEDRTDLIRRMLYAALDDFHDLFVIPLGSDPRTLAPIERVYAIFLSASDQAELGDRHIARLASFAYIEAYHDGAMRTAVASFEHSLEGWFRRWCSAHFEQPPDSPAVRTEASLCVDCLRGALMRIAARGSRAKNERVIEEQVGLHPSSSQPEDPVVGTVPV